MMTSRSARPWGAGGEAGRANAESLTIELGLAGSLSGRRLLPKRAMFPLNEDSLPAAATLTRSARPLRMSDTVGDVQRTPQRALTAYQAVFPMLEHPLSSDKVAHTGRGLQPIQQPGLALTSPEFRLTIRQDVLTASKALAGMRLSSETRASGHCGKAVPPKYQLLPLSARIKP